MSPDHHTGWANTIALEQGGCSAGTQGRRRQRNRHVGGRACHGELREGLAIEPVLSCPAKDCDTGWVFQRAVIRVPPATAAERAADKATLRRGLAHLARHGITSFQNMDGNPYQLELLRELEAEDHLTARGRIPFHFKNFMTLDALETASRMDRDYRGEMVTSGFVKLFVDGVIDSSTAVMIDGYADQPGVKCDPLFTAAAFTEVAIEADRRGLQIAVHAIGDGAVRMVLDGYQAAAQANGLRGIRHRIEHIELIHPDDIDRFAALGVIASMQPAARTGHGRTAAGADCFAHRRGALAPRLCLANAAADWSPDGVRHRLAGVADRSAAGHRMRGDATGLAGWPAAAGPVARRYVALLHPRQRLCRTDGAPKGMLRAGMLADLVVLDGDIETRPPATIHEMAVRTTICDGRVVHSADG